MGHREDRGPQSEQESIAALRVALDRGVNLIDTTADSGDSLSEQIIGRFLREQTEDVFVASKSNLPQVHGHQVRTAGGRIDTRRHTFAREFMSD